MTKTTTIRDGRQETPRQQPLQIFGDGSQTRDFIYFSDVVNAAITALEGTPQSRALNMASGKNRDSGTIEDYAENHPSTIEVRVLSKTDMEEGLPLTIQWFARSKQVLEEPFTWVNERLTDRYSPQVSALLLFLILTVTLTPVFAMRPFTYHYAFVTITATDYKITDPKHITVYGSIRNDGWLTVRLLSAEGTVETVDGIDLATGDLIGLPIDVAPGLSVSAQAIVLGYYALADLRQMKIKGIHVHAEGTYCFLTWLGCIGPFTHTYDRTFTMQELIALAKAYQIP